MVNLGIDLNEIKPCICGRMPKFEFFEGGPNRNNLIEIFCTGYACNIPEYAIGPTIELAINKWNEIVDKYYNTKEGAE